MSVQGPKCDTKGHMFFCVVSASSLSCRSVAHLHFVFCSGTFFPTRLFQSTRIEILLLYVYCLCLLFMFIDNDVVLLSH